MRTVTVVPRKTLCLARWAGDERQVQDSAQDLGREAASENDRSLQMVLSEAKVASLAAETWAHQGIAEAIATIAGLGRSAAGTGSGETAQDVVSEVADGVGKRLRFLKRQMEFKERAGDGRPELFLERRRYVQRDGALPNGRFWRIVSHPRGIELRSYVQARRRLSGQDIMRRLPEDMQASTSVMSRGVVVGVKAEHVTVHGDGRIHFIGPENSIDVLDLLETVSECLDPMWLQGGAVA